METDFGETLVFSMSGFGAGTCDVDEEGYLSAMGKRGRLDLQSGNLVFDEIPGEFARQE